MKTPHMQAHERISAKNLRAVKVLGKIGYPQSNILKSLPKLTGLSQPECARRIGVTRQAVTRIMNMDLTTPRLRELVACAYGLPVEVMFPPEK